jgi:outer membrane protein OmpA-like peptidoglycan-associated protein
MIASLASKIGQPGFGRQVTDLINHPANDAQILEKAHTLLDSQPADGLVPKFTSLLFGGNLSAITDAIGRFSGLRSGTSASLMSVGAPLLLSTLAQRVHSMDHPTLTRFLSDEAAGARGSLPEGVQHLIGSIGAPVAAAVTHEKSRNWLVPALVAAVAIVGLILWSSLQKPQSIQTADRDAIGWAERMLPGNVNLRIPVGKMEDRLLAFIQHPTGTVDSEFDFDRLLFDTDSARLQPASQEQLQSLATILRAYPSVHVKISGYTDNTGDPTANQTLSQQRADSVKQDLIGMGISADRLDAQGYGDQNPVADNSTPDGRQRNRRITLRVTQT